jgi:RNA recognition motif-containing protein
MLFEPYGELIRIDMKRNYAFVQFKSIEDAIRARDATNGGKLDQSEITVEFVARTNPPPGDRGGSRGGREDRRGGSSGGGRYDDRGECGSECNVIFDPIALHPNSFRICYPPSRGPGGYRGGRGMRDENRSRRDDYRPRGGGGGGYRGDRYDDDYRRGGGSGAGYRDHDRSRRRSSRSRSRSPGYRRRSSRR